MKIQQSRTYVPFQGVNVVNPGTVYKHIIKQYSTVGVKVFTGSGLNDLTFGGTYTGSTTPATFTVILDNAVASPDTFKWRKDAGAWTTGVAITAGVAQTLQEGVTVTFAAGDGHTLNDQWVSTCTLVGGLQILDPAGNSVFSLLGSAFTGAVALQAATPGTAQTGHLNISGTAIATTFVGALTGNASSATLWGAYAAIAGPAQARTFTLPDASTTILTTNAVVTAVQGGTGQSVYAAGDLLYAPTTTTLAGLPDVATGQVLVSGGVGVAPAYSATPSLTSLMAGIVGTPATVLEATDTVATSPRGIMSSQYNDGADGARLHTRKARGTRAAPTVIVTADNLGRWVGSGYDGAAYQETASITFGTEGTIAAGRVPTNISFWTGTDAAASVLTQAMKISSAQQVAITSAATSGTMLALSVPTATSLTAALTGQSIDLSTNVTATGYSVTGQTIAMPAVTNTGTGTYAYKAMAVTSGALVQNTGAGTNTWVGLDITTPNKTATTGSISTTALKITKTTVAPDYYIYMDGNTYWNGGGSAETTGAWISTRNNLATTPIASFWARNNTPASSGVPVQMSPSVQFKSSVWNTTPTAASNDPWFTIDNLPASGTAPTAGLRFNYSLSTTGIASYTEIARLDGVGAIGALKGNFLLGSTASPTSATNTIGLGLATAPTAVASGVTAIYSSPLGGGGSAALGIFQEYVPYAGVGVASTHKWPITINGTQYYALLTTVP